MDTPTYEEDPAAWGIVRELMDNNIDLNGQARYDLDEAQTFLQIENYSDAEPFLIAGIEKLHQVRELLSQEGESLVAKVCPKDVNPETVLRFAWWELEEDIEGAEWDYSEVRRARDLGIDQIPAKERYRRLLRKRRRLLYGFLLRLFVSTVVIVVIGRWAYSVTPWLLVIPIGGYLALAVFFFLRWAFGVESLIPLSDGEVREFMRRDGLLVNPGDEQN